MDTPVIDCVITEELVYVICKIQFTNYGIHVGFPKNTPPHLTYQWRTIKSITKKFIEWEFDTDDITLFMRVAASKLKNNNNTRKGVNVLFDKDLLDRCKETIEEMVAIEKQTGEHIKQTHDFITIAANRNPLHQGRVDKHLLTRNKPGAMSNIVAYYQSGRLSKTYLAFSIACNEALNRLEVSHNHERLLCPSQSALYYTRTYHLKNLKLIMRQTLGRDCNV